MFKLSPRKLPEKFLLATLLIGAAPVIAQPYVPYIFDWPTFVGDTGNDITPVPHPFRQGDWDWRDHFDYQDAHGKPVAAMLRIFTGPVHGESTDHALGTVLNYAATNGYAMNFVFADFEKVDKYHYTQQMAEEDTLEMVALVRDSGNPANVRNAFIGNYSDYGTCTDAAAIWGVSTGNRQAECDFYHNSGMNVAMPNLYQNTADIRHHSATMFAANHTLSDSHAMFWAPLERFSAAKAAALTDGHMIIPWVGDYVVHDNPERTQYLPAAHATRAETRSILQHVRLRGADGYYSLLASSYLIYASDIEARDDLYGNAWRPLDILFKRPGTSRILNPVTDKNSGREWSGVYRGNRALFLFTNYATSTTQFTLPTSVDNLPISSPVIAANTTNGPGVHTLVDYVIGPVSRWKLDEGSGEDVFDQLASDVDGDVAGATWSSGIRGGALSLDGVDDGIGMGDEYDLGTSDRTISLWMKTSANSSNYQTLVAKGYSSTAAQFSISMLNNKIVALTNVRNSYSDPNNYRILHSATTLNDGQWHHVALAIDRSDAMKLYIDGALHDSVEIKADASIDAQDSYGLYLGRTNNGQYFPGSIDDVQIFPGALDAEDVLDEYAGILNVRLNDRSGATAKDDSWKATDGTISGAAWVQGKTALGALAFDGVDDGVAFGDVDDIGTGSRTVSLWMKTSTSSANYQTLITKGYSATAAQFSISMLNGKIVALTNMRNSYSDPVNYHLLFSDNTLNDDKWHHIVLTIDRNANMTLYVDGVSNDSVAIGADAAIDPQDAYGLFVGRTHSGQYFPGTIDEVKMYDKALSTQQVQYLYDVNR